MTGHSNDFLWHFQHEWQTRFQHKHWWREKPADASPQAALWEAMRRHPGAQRRVEANPRNRYSVTSTLGGFLGVFALRSWPELRPISQQIFLNNLWKESPRYRTFCTPPGTVLNYFNGADDAGNIDLHALHRADLVPIAIDLDANPAVAAKWVEETLRQLQAKAYHKGKPTRKKAKRAFPSEWLDVILKFEKEELSLNHKANIRNDQLFARYRRVIRQAWFVPTG
jgi:hypothetical protein